MLTSGPIHLSSAASPSSSNPTTEEEKKNRRLYSSLTRTTHERGELVYPPDFWSNSLLATAAASRYQRFLCRFGVFGFGRPATPAQKGTWQKDGNSDGKRAIGSPENPAQWEGRLSRRQSPSALHSSVSLTTTCSLFIPYSHRPSQTVQTGRVASCSRRRPYILFLFSHPLDRPALVWCHASEAPSRSLPQGPSALHPDRERGPAASTHVSFSDSPSYRHFVFFFPERNLVHSFWPDCERRPYAHRPPPFDRSARIRRITISSPTKPATGQTIPPTHLNAFHSRRSPSASWSPECPGNSVQLFQRARFFGKSISIFLQRRTRRRL
ncbi:hypothetical protein B0H67DRAFT_364677 [Lasiosphaeris hirsuta]|uniref:Uncharacterized protein n=1 Tax=Lasiosphaeris hirsuta TaxID=260670 RepID=A0AA39ZWN5_9PEZI|nr:hypothetical protein B0H67DRAFT_364677 [Lasiosphaeris hirsuta]